MEWLETDPIPEECRNCREDCYNCDIAGKRWVLSREDQLRIRRTLKMQAIARLQRQVEGIDRELDSLKKIKAEMPPPREMIVNFQLKKHRILNCPSLCGQHKKAPM